MGESTINSLPGFGIKEYVVNSKEGPSVVRVAFNSHSASTSSSSTGSGVLINIGTKNMSSNADLHKAVNSAVSNASPSNIDNLVKNSARNILSSADEAIKAASLSVPNEDVMGLLM